MAATFGKALGALGMSSSVMEVFFTNHQQEVNKAKFADHLSTYGISYETDDEYQMRMDKYCENDEIILKVNSEQSNYQLGHNHMSTWTDDEKKKLLGEDITIGKDMKDKDYAELKSSSLGNAEIDWVAAGHVAPVQNQLTCGSCWAFAAVATIESHNSILNNQLVKLSEQQLVDCATLANGCEGGNFPPAYFYALNNPVQPYETYPYTNSQNTCTADRSLGQVQIGGWYTVPPNSVAWMKEALTMGPVGIAVEAYNPHFQLYQNGILDTTSCGQALDHAVDAVGWGTYNGQEYLMVRNSWGTGWGDDGYIYIALNDQNICGILSQPFMPHAPTMV